MQNIDVTAMTMTVDQGAVQVLVDRSQLAYNPLESDVYQQIRQGGRVLVAGDMQSGFFQPGKASTVD